MNDNSEIFQIVQVQPGTTLWHVSPQEIAEFQDQIELYTSPDVCQSITYSGADVTFLHQINVTKPFPLLWLKKNRYPAEGGAESISGDAFSKAMQDLWEKACEPDDPVWVDAERYIPEGQEWRLEAMRKIARDQSGEGCSAPNVQDTWKSQFLTAEFLHTWDNQNFPGVYAKYNSTGDEFNRGVCMMGSNSGAIFRTGVFHSKQRYKIARFSSSKNKAMAAGVCQFLRKKGAVWVACNKGPE